MKRSLSSESPTLGRIYGYALGDGAVAISTNGVSNFALLYYGQILGITGTQAGIALSIGMLWDAVSDPIMGHLTDQTRSRWGRRHPYLLIGGLGVALSFLCMWLLHWLPAAYGMTMALVIATNLVLRTSLTVFSVPYTALGFEMCRDYIGRSKLQGARSFVNQVSNFIFGALAWSLFFTDQKAVDGSRIDGSSIAGNYVQMGFALSAGVFLLACLCTWITWPYAKDNRADPVPPGTLKVFLQEIYQISRERMVWWVFGFFSVAQFGMMVVGQAQMFSYVFFMELTDREKTFVHGGGMLAYALAALWQGWLTQRLDKKKTGYLAMGICMFSGLALATIFLWLGMPARTEVSFIGVQVPVGVGIFALGQFLWWGGCGMLVPIALSMVADLSEIHYLKTGLHKEGTYSAMFTFTLKACLSLGLLFVGKMVDLAGIVPEAKQQTTAAVQSITAVTFLVGPLFIFASFFLLALYPVNREWMQALEKNEEKSD
ncbi:MAG: MFS transporter [Verrucomicrobia bacterium]|nr:MAG: MFS transporter [Verrucomicrobiota bacterium]